MRKGAGERDRERRTGDGSKRKSEKGKFLGQREEARDSRCRTTRRLPLSWLWEIGRAHV